MQKKAILLLIGGRNASPALMGALQFVDKIDRVKFLLCKSTDVNYEGFREYIFNILKSQNPHMEYIAEKDCRIVDPFDINDCYRKTEELLTDESCLLSYVNLITVPQPMAITVYTYVNERFPDALIFSNYTDNSRIIPLKVGQDPLPITNILNVEQFINACGVRLVSTKHVPNQLGIDANKVDTIVDYIVDKISTADGVLKLLRRKDENSRPQSVLTNIKLAFDAFVGSHCSKEDALDLLTRMADVGLVSKPKQYNDHYRFNYSSPAAFSLIQGDWLEYYVYKECCKLDFDSVEMGVKLDAEVGEVDVFCVHHANPLICECKSGDFEKKELTVLESLANRLGGNYCVRIFVTSNPQNMSLTKEGTLNNAESRRIRLVSGMELPKISKIIKKEMENPTYARR